MIYMSNINEDPPWRQYKLLKQEKIEWNSTFFCLSGCSVEPKLTYLEEEINVLKKEIETVFVDSYNWDLWKKLGNPYEFIYTPTKENNPLPSIAIQNPLSRSYFKLWEILYLVDYKFPQRIKTAHVCEGPGGFIQCLYDLADKRRFTIGETFAMTLRPDNPSIPGWKRATNFLKRHRNISIEYGPENDGNILNPVNQDYFIQKSKGSFIFTADGGFDFSEEYDKQESNMFSLILNSILIALQVLSPGGMCVIKIFDMHNELTKDLISVLASSFKSWSIYKPATSRPCNSERYFVGIDYRGRVQVVIDMLKILKSMDVLPESFLCEEIRVKFADKFIEQNQPILQRQHNAISGVLEAAKKYTYDEYFEKAVKLVNYAEDWCKKFSIAYTPATKTLVPKK